MCNHWTVISPVFVNICCLMISKTVLRSSDDRGRGDHGTVICNFLGERFLFKVSKFRGRFHHILIKSLINYYQLIYK